ncbi:MULTISPECIES: hypothetical protein [unclassified Luteibacter]|uniref:hypothetical protein n=1 Tax=Luteibacter sp. PvP019 TaxID=3156436 RepID=UPI003391B5B1
MERDAALGWLIFIAFVVATSAIYAPGVHGGFIFDDFPNIVDNPGVQPSNASLASMVRSALSSPSSEFKRPLASLTFAANFLVSGMNASAMKVTNVVIHLANGLLVFLLCVLLLRSIGERTGGSRHTSVTAALVAGCWLLLPINLTAVLYVVQRMESLANFFVLLGLLGYARSRMRMQRSVSAGGLIAAVASILFFTALGLMAKETAVLLPLYALAIELVVFRGLSLRAIPAGTPISRDKRIVAMYVLLLAIPMVAGLAWILPSLLSPSGWSTRDFTLGTRLLSEARIVADYMTWTIAPTPGALSFYHDDFVTSTGLLSPWTTAISIAILAGVAVLAFALRSRLPAVSLGLLFFLSCHLLTGTILPLELVYEHRNYFASMGLMLAIIPLLVPWTSRERPGFVLLRRTLLIAFMANAGAQLVVASKAWSNPLSLAQELAERAPTSPRAQYELGRTYIILSRYKPESPFSPLVYAPLEAAAALKGSTILPEQALIFFNSRLDRPLKDAWWESINRKLEDNKIGVQDESALGALSDCMRQQLCQLPTGRMMQAYLAALSHESRSARLLAMYSDFAWNQLNDRKLSLQVSREAVAKNAREPAYRVSLINKLVAMGNLDEARKQRDQLAAMNVAGAYDTDIARIDAVLARH